MSLIVIHIPCRPLLSTSIPAIDLRFSGTSDKILSQIAHPAVFANNGRYFILQMGMGGISSFRLIHGSWHSVHCVLSGPWTVGNTAKIHDVTSPIVLGLWHSIVFTKITIEKMPIQAYS